MAQTLPSGIKKFDPTDTVSRAAFNENWDAIDGKLTTDATTSARGMMSAADKTKLNGITAGAAVTSVAGKTGAVTLVKGDVGLPNTPNYPAATQAQAEAGTDNGSLMTPIRTKQYVDKRLLNNMMWRINNGLPEWSNNNGGSWNVVAAVKSVQRGKATMVASVKTLNIDISSVDVSRSVVFTNASANSANANEMFLLGDLTSSNVLLLERLSSAQTAQIIWQVVEYY